MNKLTDIFQFGIENIYDENVIKEHNHFVKDFHEQIQSYVKDACDEQIDICKELVEKHNIILLDVPYPKGVE